MNPTKLDEIIEVCAAVFGIIALIILMIGFGLWWLARVLVSFVLMFLMAAVGRAFRL